MKWTPNSVSISHSMEKIISELKSSSILRAIAIFEGGKGFAAIAASLGLLSLAHHDIRALAYALIGHYHLDPEAHFPRMLLDEATWLQSADLRQVVMLACGYSLIRFAEGYGLWRDRTWAEWLASCSGAIYLPIEISHMLKHPSWINAMVLAFNAVVVVYMVIRLWQRSKNLAPKLVSN